MIAPGSDNHVCGPAHLTGLRNADRHCHGCLCNGDADKRGKTDGSFRDFHKKNSIEAKSFFPRIA
jgi:hypothetical protein